MFQPLPPDQLQPLYKAFLASTGICTDSRKLFEGCLFVALKGPSFDGNRFALQALEQGALAAIVDDPALPERSGLLQVADGLHALQSLAHHHRQQQTEGSPDFRLVAITGSNGKTTTKELIAHFYAGQASQPVFVTPGNLNNQIGVPLCLLQLQPHHQMAVLEFGDNRTGDIDLLCRIAEPDAGLITNLGRDHIGLYGSMEANVAGKLELFDYLRETVGTALVNTDDPHLRRYSQQHPELDCLAYGRAEDLNVDVETAGLQGQTLVLQGLGTDPLTVETALPGVHNAQNVLAAAAVAVYLGLPPEVVAHAAAHYRPQNNRSQLLEVLGIPVLLDAYNANPSSMQAALDLVFGAGPGAVGLVLGEMNELGAYSTDEHVALAQRVNALNPAWTIVVGAQAEPLFAALAGRKAHFLHATEARDTFRSWLPVADRVLLKGSRSVALEQLVG